jgi:sugar/nucleoside kinase (ribokinase family)
MHAAAIARAVGVLTIVDVDFVWPGLHDLLRLIDVIVMPGPTVQAAAGQGGVGSALGEIGRRSGALTVVATLGAEGALAWSDGEEVRIPGRREHVVDTTGAGDAFRAGFAAGLLGRAGTRPDLGDLLADANLVAALACRELGAQTALPKGLEVPAHLRGPV